MKKIILLVMAASFLLAGCSQAPITTPDPVVTTQSTAMLNAGYLIKVRPNLSSINKATNYDLTFSGWAVCEQLDSKNSDQVFTSMMANDFTSTDAYAIMGAAATVLCPQHLTEVKAGGYVLN